MIEMDDGGLLRLYVRDRSEAAFSALVGRHAAMVYATAKRQSCGDEARARDAAQEAFVALAKKARRLTSHASLAGWLHQAARLSARQDIRRSVAAARRERSFVAENEVSLGLAESPPPVDAWLAQLSARDREALLLRFFEERSFPEVAQALQISEDAARMRVDRALDRLRHRARKQGITSVAAATEALLAATTAGAAPANLVASLSSAALRASVGGAHVLAWSGLSFSTIGAMAGSVAMALLVGLAVVTHVRNASPKSSVAAYLGTPAPSAPTRADPARASPGGRPAIEGPPRIRVAIVPVPNTTRVQDGKPVAISLTGPTYAGEIATTMFWGDQTFGFSEDQREIVQGLYQRMREKQAAEESALIQVDEEAPGMVALTIPAYPGEALLQEFADGLNKWLGPGMGDRFFTAYRVALLRDSYGFGEYPQHIRLVRKDAETVEITHAYQYNPMQRYRMGATVISIETPVKTSAVSNLSVNQLASYEFLRPYIPPEK